MINKRKFFIIFIVLSCLSLHYSVKADFFMGAGNINTVVDKVNSKLNGAINTANDVVNFVKDNIMNEEALTIATPILVMGAVLFSVYLQQEFSSSCCDNLGNYYDNPDHDNLCSLPRVGDGSFSILKFYCPVPLGDGSGRMVVPKGW